MSTDRTAAGGGSRRPDPAPKGTPPRPDKPPAAAPAASTSGDSAAVPPRPPAAPPAAPAAAADPRKAADSRKAAPAGRGAATATMTAARAGTGGKTPKGKAAKGASAGPGTRGRTGAAATGTVTADEPEDDGDGDVAVAVDDDAAGAEAGSGTGAGVRAGTSGTGGTDDDEIREAGTAARSVPVTRTRRARLKAARIDPWSVMKVSFLLSAALGVVLLVALTVLWVVLDGMGVFTSVGDTIKEVTESENSAGFDLKESVSLQNTLLFGTVIAIIDVILVTALATLGAFVYNLTASFTGGVEVTLAEED